jgi:hypothetical protein
MPLTSEERRLESNDNLFPSKSNVRKIQSTALSTKIHYKKFNKLGTIIIKKVIFIIFMFFFLRYG